MKTEELKRQLPPVYSQENVANPMVWVKYFHPLSYWIWYGFEYDEEDIFFGWVSGFQDELGYFSLREMEGVGVMLGVERDLHSIGPHPLHATISPCRLYGARGFDSPV